MDILGDILATLGLRTSIYFRAELSAPYAIAVPQDATVIRFHLIDLGACVVTAQGGESARFVQGDLVLVPHGAAHVLASATDLEPTPLGDVLTPDRYDGKGLLTHGGGGAGASLVCGYFAFEQELMHPIIATLPALIHMRNEGGQRYAWLQQLLAYAEYESKTRPEAWQEVVQRISEILFIFVLREYMRSQPIATGALFALADGQLSKALQAIHEAPAHDWTVDLLAERAAMSRSAFAERFRESLGVTPARYMVAWRMHKARAMVGRSSRSIREIAWDVGYDSEAAFNRVFKEHFGAPPGRYRRAMESEPA